MATKKNPATPVPQNAEAAGIVLAELGALQRESQAVAEKTDAAITALQKEANAQLTQIHDRMRSSFTALRVFADARRQELTQDGKKKTVDLGTGKVYWRNTPPKINIENEAAVLAKVQEMGLTKFFRKVPQLDRQAMNKNPEEAAKVPGVETTQEELFYAKPTEGTGELNEHKLNSLLKTRE